MKKLFNTLILLFVSITLFAQPTPSEMQVYKDSARTTKSALNDYLTAYILQQTGSSPDMDSINRAVWTTVDFVDTKIADLLHDDDFSIAHYANATSESTALIAGQTIYSSKGVAQHVKEGNDILINYVYDKLNTIQNSLGQLYLLVANTGANVEAKTVSAATIGALDTAIIAACDAAPVSTRRVINISTFWDGTNYIGTITYTSY